MSQVSRRHFIAAAGLAGAAVGAGAQDGDEENTPDRRALVSYCGIYCGLCSARTQIPERARALIDALENGEHPTPDDVRRWLEDLGKVPADKYCRSGKCGHPACSIRKCAIDRKLEVCPECDEYPCERIHILAASEPTLLHDGARIKEHGLDAWIDEQEERKRCGFCYSDIRCLPCTVPTD